MISDEELKKVVMADIEKVIADYAERASLSDSFKFEITRGIPFVYDLITELRQCREEERKTCKWEEDIDGFLQTSCGHGFVLKAGNLSENHMKFCPFCGHCIEENP